MYNIKDVTGKEIDIGDFVVHVSVTQGRADEELFGGYVQGIAPHKNLRLKVKLNSGECRAYTPATLRIVRKLNSGGSNGER